ncbi:hypothetical protein AnigIFM56816_000850 [Aspergillus niger]|nr:hypothetical protein AnigIFM56816_000850 [Aspergillus niger]
MKSILVLFAFGLCVTQTQGCEIPGTFCIRYGAKACECNGGHQLECQVTVAPMVDGQGGETEMFWTRFRDCPVPVDGGLQCINGMCTS